MLLSSKPAYTLDKAVFRAACGRAKHAVLQGVQQASRGGGVFACRVCARKGSGPEQAMHKLLEAEQQVELFAVEACALSSPRLLETAAGGTLHVGRKRWDAVLLAPANLLIEVQGEQHHSKLCTRAHNLDADLADRLDKDQRLAAAAQAAGFSVLWLCVGEAHETRRARAARWAASLRQAVMHVQAHKPPTLFVSPAP